MSKEVSEVSDARTCKTIMRGVNQRIKRYAETKVQFDIKLDAMMQRFKIPQAQREPIQERMNMLSVLSNTKEGDFPFDESAFRERWGSLNSMNIGLNNKARETLDHLIEVLEMGCELQPIEQDQEKFEDEQRERDRLRARARMLEKTPFYYLRSRL